MRYLIVLLLLPMAAGLGGCTDDASETTDSDDASNQWNTEPETEDGNRDDNSDADDSRPDSGSERGEHCHQTAADWPQSHTEFEWNVLEEINDRREAGDTCRDNNGNDTFYESRPAMIMDDNLWCSARVHSYWMAEQGVLSHNSPGGPIGDTPRERMNTAGYDGRGWAENIASGQNDPAAVVQSWMNSTDGHCTAIMGNYNIIGVGYATADGDSRRSHYWTLNFGN